MMACRTSVLGTQNEILLVEKSAMIGSIIVSTARQLQLRPVRLVTNCNSAQLFLENQVFCGLITSLDEAEAAFNMIHQLRQGQLRCDAKMPVAVTTSQCDMTMANRIKSLCVQRILLKPFKIRDLVTTIQTLVATPPDGTLRGAGF